MIRIPLVRLTVAAAVLPLSLGLASCGKKDGGNVSGAAAATVAAPAGKAWSDIVAKTPDGGYLMGNPNAPIKLIEYGSLSCPHCAKFAEESYDELVTKFVGSGRVSYEFRSFAIHPQDVPLTVLAQCGSPETFFPLIHQIYTNFDAMNAPLGDPAVQAKANASAQVAPPQRFVALADALGYSAFFAQRGISLDQGKACLLNSANAQGVADHAQKYGEDGITGTPSLLVNGTKVDSTEWSATRQALMAAGAR
ncbi:MAG: protein-disulfide isomerase [Novosphingobium sp.]|nr:protein-disulfide isomerase [Novosphingobium sp.]